MITFEPMITYEELMALLWRWKYGGLPLVTINDVRQAVIRYGESQKEDVR